MQALKLGSVYVRNFKIYLVRSAVIYLEVISEIVYSPYRGLNGISRRIDDLQWV